MDLLGLDDLLGGTSLASQAPTQPQTPPPPLALQLQPQPQLSPQVCQDTLPTVTSCPHLVFLQSGVLCC